MNTELTKQQKQHAHGMIERLAPEKLSAVVGLQISSPTSASPWTTSARAARTPRFEAHHHLRRSQGRHPRHSPSHCLNIPTAIHRLAESDSGDVKTLKGNAGEKRLRASDSRARFTEEHPDSLRLHTVRNRKDAYK